MEIFWVESLLTEVGATIWMACFRGLLFLGVAEGVEGALGAL